jgi:hypothetical protein
MGTDLPPSVPEPPKSESRSIESDRNLGLVEEAVSRSLETAIVTQDSGKETVAVLSQHSEGDQSLTGTTRLPLSTVRPLSIVSPKSMAVKLNVLKSPGTNENGDEGAREEPIYFVNRAATEEGRKDGSSVISVAYSTVVSEGDDYTDADEIRTLVSSASFMENHVDPCLFFWRCGAGGEPKIETKVETPKASALPKKRLPSSRIDTPRIVLTEYSGDSETEVEANKHDLDSPYEDALSDKKKKFRAKLRAIAKKRESVLSSGRERARRAQPEVRDDVECERESQENDDNESSQSSCSDAGDYSFESQASSLSKGNAKDKRSWKKLLGIKTARVLLE